jgi:multisubunit Na+/H+ antiporter MnhG subunit
MRVNWLIVIGFFMVLAGAVLPFLIVIRLLPSTYLLNFSAFAASTAGIFLGVLGVAAYVGERRRRDDWRNL